MIVDAHVLFEHLHVGIFKADDNTLASNKFLTQNKLRNLFEAFALTSYDRKSPKLFFQSKGHRVVTNKDSYFDVMNTYKVWKAYETGYRTRLSSELCLVKRDYEEHLKTLLDRDSILYQLAFQSLLFTTSWIEECLRYIDEVYEEYTESKFDTQCAWHVTTRLAMALLEHIAQLRTGVKHAFNNRDRIHMKESTFYATVRSLDKMREIYKAVFKNSPIVANALVKVLARNTQVQAIETLKGDLLSLRNQQSEIKSKQAEATKIANGANNKSNQVKNEVSDLESALKALTKRVEKCEKP